MVSIGDIELEITENEYVFAHVSYRLRGNRRDVRERQRYSEEVRLIADDQGPGEDGVDDSITGGTISFQRIVFENTDSVFRRHSQMLGRDDLDEDPGFSGLLPALDEFRAEVILTELPGSPIVGESNVVQRGHLFRLHRPLQIGEREPVRRVTANQGIRS
jgi:hypothetical protein